MRITIDGQTIRAVNLNSARGRDVVALQTQTGYGLDEIVAMSQDKTRQALVNKFVEFLSEHNRGRFVTWDEVLDRPLALVEPDPGDNPDADAAGVEGAEDPTSASTASQPADADASVPAKPATRASTRSTAKSGGSKARSTSASSNS